MAIASRTGSSAGNEELVLTALPFTYRFAPGPRGQGGPDRSVDRAGCKANAGVAQEHIAAAGMVGPHLIDVSERVIRWVDQGRELVDPGSGMDVDSRRGAVEGVERILRRR